MSLTLIGKCARTGCEEAVEVDLDTLERVGELAQVAGIFDDLDGWGFDYVGLNEVFHCPAHRPDSS